MKDQALEIAEKHLGHRGKMISFSKSGYAKQFSDNLVIFNSNVCTKEGKIWYGDIDVTLSYDSLSDLARETGKTVYVLTEVDGRFENEESPLLKKAIIQFLPEGGHDLTSSLSYYKKFNLKTNK